MAAVDFARRLADHGAAPALAFAWGSLSYAALARRVDRLATRMGTAKKLVAVEATLSRQTIVTYLAALRGGHAVLLAPAGDPVGWHALVERFRPDLLVRRADGRWRWETLAPGNHPALHPDLALILLTSGSTGTGKAVRLTGSAVATNARAIAQYLGLGSDDRGALFLPLHYSYGLSVLNSHLAVGASLFVTGGSILEPGFLDALQAQRCTNIAGVPFSFELFESVGFRNRAFPDLRFMTVAGGRLATDMVRRYHGHLAAGGRRLFVMYGQTEATARIAYVPPALVGQRPDCIGVAIPGGELGLVDAAGRPIGVPGIEGELVYRGPNVMLGYAESRSDLARGSDTEFLCTGDLAVRDPDGLYRITGRRRRMSKIAGIRIGHDAVEANLARSGIAAAVVGNDSTILAAYSASCRPDEVRTRLAAATGLALAHVRAVEVDTLPRLATGKVDYETVRRWLEADGRSAADVVDAFRRAFWPYPVAAGDSFVTLGGDSLRYLELSLLLGRHLGRPPHGWERMSIAELAARRPAGRGAETIGTDIAIRVLAISMVLVHHASGWPLAAGSATMMALIGYSLGRFQLDNLLHRRLGRFFRPLLGVLLPYLLLLAGFALAWQSVPWASLFLVSNLGFGTLEQHTMLPYLYWFVEAYAQTLLFWAMLFLLPPVRRLARESPFRLGLVLLLVALLARFVGPELWPIGGRTIFAPWWLLPLVCLGWCAAFADTAGRRGLLLTVTAAVMVLLAYVGGNWTGSWLRYGLQVPVIACLLYRPRLAIPVWLARIVVPVAAASFHIYLFHYFANELLKSEFAGLPSPLAVALLVLSGVGFGLAAYLAQKALIAGMTPRMADPAGWRWPPVHSLARAGRAWLSGPRSQGDAA